MVPLSPTLSKYINITKGKLFSFTQFKLDLVVNQMIYAKNAVEWIDMMMVRLSDGTYEIPAIINTDAVRKAIGKPNLDLYSHLITKKKLTIKRSCLNICRKKEGITPYIFVLDFTVGDDVHDQQGRVDICLHQDVKKWIDTLLKGETAPCSSNYDTTDLEIRVKNLKGQEAMLEYILSKKTKELEDDDGEHEEMEEEHLDMEVHKPLVPMKYDTFEDYQHSIDKIWDQMDGIPDNFCFPVYYREEEKKVNSLAIEAPPSPPQPSNAVEEEEMEEDTAESISVTDGQTIQEQLKIATVPAERNRLVRKLRVFYFSNNISCSLT